MGKLIDVKSTPIQETIENIENFGLSLDLYYHSPYNNEEYERDMEEEY